MATTSCIPSKTEGASRSSWAVVGAAATSAGRGGGMESYTTAAAVPRDESNGRESGATSSMRRHRNPRQARRQLEQRRSAAMSSPSTCCISFPSSSFASQNDRLMRKDGIVGKKAYVTQSVLSVTTSPSQSTDGSSGCGPSTKASTVVPWPSPSTDADSDVVEASSSASSSLKHHRRSDPRSSSDGSSRQEVAGDTLDRTDLAYFLPALTKVLDHLIYIGEEKERSMLPNSMPLRSRYHSVTVPNISVSDYLSRLARFFNCSGECFVIALIYLDRAVKESTRTTIDDYDDNLTNAGSCWEETTGAAAAQSQKQQPTNQSFNITRLNIHRLLLTALTLAAKYYDDCYYANKRYAEVGGVSTRELNSLEASFLDMIHYRLFVAPEEYSAYKEQVENVLNPPTPTPSTPSSPSTYCSSV